MNATQAIKILKRRFENDIVITECKTGSSYQGCTRMDMVVVKKTWSPVSVLGIEVKVSRSDFLADKKWTDYLQYCTEFYFACPAGLIQPNEITSDVGLIWMTQNRATVKVKPNPTDYRNMKPDALLYILMWRYGARDGFSTKSDIRYWRELLEEKKCERTLGHAVSKKVARALDEIREHQRENARLREQIKTIEHYIPILQELGLFKSYYSEFVDDARQRIAAAIERKVLEGGFSNLTKAIDQLMALNTDIQKLIQGVCATAVPVAKENIYNNEANRRACAHQNRIYDTRRCDSCRLLESQSLIVCPYAGMW